VTAPGLDIASILSPHGENKLGKNPSKKEEVAMAKKLYALADDGYRNLDRDPASSTYVTDEEDSEFKKAMNWFKELIAEQEAKLE